MSKTSFDSGYAQLGPLKMYYEIHGPGRGDNQSSGEGDASGKAERISPGKVERVSSEKAERATPGKGKVPLVLIHGGGSTIRITFGQVLDAFATDRQVIAVELQAHGHTRDIGKPSSFKQDADDVAALLHYLHIPRADIFGFSNGGHTAMQIGISHPEVVNRLVIASAFYRRDGAIPGFFDGFDQATLMDMPAELKAAYLKEDPDPEHLQVMFERDKTRMAEFADWPDTDLQGIKAQTLIFNADHDVMTNEHAVKMAQLIPGASLIIVPGTHGSYLGESEKMAEVTVTLVKEFLDK